MLYVIYVGLYIESTINIITLWSCSCYLVICSLYLLLYTYYAEPFMRNILSQFFFIKLLANSSPLDTLHILTMSKPFLCNYYLQFSVEILMIQQRILKRGLTFWYRHWALHCFTFCNWGRAHYDSWHWVRYGFNHISICSHIVHCWYEWQAASKIKHIIWPLAKNIG